MRNWFGVYRHSSLQRARGTVAGLTLTGPLSLNSGTGAGSYTASSSARHYWSLTGPGVLPDAAAILAGTGALDYGFFDADAGAVVTSISFDTGIDVTGGVFSVVARVEPSGDWSNVLRDESVDVYTVVSLASHVVSFAAASTDGLTYTITANSLVTAARLETGMWFAASWYYDGANGTGAIMGIADVALTNSYLTLQCGRATWRIGGGSDQGSTDLGLPGAAGWQSVVGYLRKSTTLDGEGHREKVEFWRNGTAGTRLATTASGTITEAANWNRLGIGHNPRSAPNLQFAGEVAEFAMGTGRPTGLSAWLHNAGAFGRHISAYDFAGNGLTLLERIDLTALNPASELAAADAGLQSLNSNMVTPTLVGRTTSGTGPQWLALAPPSEL